jgi:ATP-dependent DNA ligase
VSLSDPGVSAKFIRDLGRFNDCVLNGELTIPGIPRYISNGIIASLISIGKKIKDGENVSKEINKFEKEHEMNYEDALNSIVYTVWDTITVDEYFDAKSNTPYKQRLVNLGQLIVDAWPTNDPNYCLSVKVVEGKEVSSFDEAMAHFQELLNRGEEGTILKAVDGKWKDGKPTWQIKFKLEMDVDLKIVGFNYGKAGTKNENVISSLNCETSDGLLKTKPTGMKEKVMDYVTKNQDKLLGTIVECECSGLSNDSNGNYSLMHPRFKKFRDDKNTCDSLESVKQIEAMAKGLA